MGKQFKDMAATDFGLPGISGKAIATEKGHGTIEGYASTFGNVDRVGDVVMPGAFAKTIAERLPTGKIKLMGRHFAYGGDGLETVGTITELREDAKGLYFKADVADTDMAQQYLKLAKGGHLSASSIGYQVMKAAPSMREGQEVQELHELKLYEVTLTNNPANEMAELIGAKNAAFLNALKNGDSSATADRVIDALGGEEGAKALLENLGSMIEVLKPIVEGKTVEETGESEEESEGTKSAADVSSYLRRINENKTKLIGV